MAQSNRKLLATFVQVSDLHIGEVDLTSGDAMLDQRAAQVVSNMTWFDGLLGHHGLALQELEAFCGSLSDGGENFEVIVTGDYSRSGSALELGLANKYFVADIGLVPPCTTGLRLGKGNVPIGIPGNHDHWAGRFHPVGGSPSQYPIVFPTPSLPYVLSRTVGQRQLVFAGINSDYDVGPFSQARVLAKGDFQNELGKLGPKLGPKRPGEIRVLLIHHSWHKVGLKLRMRRASKQALEKFLVQYGFSAIMTGHTHDPLLQSFQVGPQSAQVPIWELRCGTTTQHDVVPYKWSTMMGLFPSRPKWPQNTLVLHRLYGSPGQTMWEAQIYERAPGGFKTLGHPGFKTFPV